MITVFDMETGEILECSRRSATPARGQSNRPLQDGLMGPALQLVEADRPAAGMPPDLATLDLAEILARFR